jgi:hypothetical protein
MSTLLSAPAKAPVASDEVTVVTTDRWEDVQDALGLVHDGFVEAGYMEEQSSQRRLIAPYLNPGVAFAMAYVGEQLAGVLALMPDGPFGLPSDSAFRQEMDSLRATGRPLFESGSLVVAPGFRRHTRRVLAGLVAANIRMFRETPDAVLVISTEPRQADFYRSLNGSSVISEVRDHYGAPAVLLCSDYPVMVDVMDGAATNGQRMISALVLDDDAPWLNDRRSGERWPIGEVTALMAEQVDPSALSELVDAPPVVAGLAGDRRNGMDRRRGLRGSGRRRDGGLAKLSFGTSKEVPLRYQGTQFA